MNLGFVGVGQWAQKLATAFRECGAEIVAYDRASSPTQNPPHFGTWYPWHDQIASDKIDALIICAPPEVTTEVALECAKAGKRCVATKPLLWTEYPSELFRDLPGLTGEQQRVILRYWEVLNRSLYVDLWRLYSPAWLALKEELRGKKIDRIDVSFCGNGPFRSFNGALDYGPHALAFVFDLLGSTEVTDLQVTELEAVEGGKLYGADMRVAGTFASMTIGNGAQEPKRQVDVWVDDRSRWTFVEPENGTQAFLVDVDEPRITCTKALALRRFCRAFMACEPSRTLEYSIAAMRVLERIIA